MSAKELINNFYQLNLTNNLSEFSEFLHEDFKLHWASSKGFNVFDYDSIMDFIKGIFKSYSSLRYQISHMTAEGNFVTVRLMIFVRTVENPEEEIPLAHFVNIWEVRDNKIYEGYRISQLGDDSPLSLASFSERKI